MQTRVRQAMAFVFSFTIAVSVATATASEEAIPKNDAARKRMFLQVKDVWGPNEIYLERAGGWLDLPARATIALDQNGQRLLNVLSAANCPSLLGIVRADRRTTITIGYLDTGFVDLNKALPIDAQALLEALKANAAQDDARREAGGLSRVGVPKWLTPPLIDAQTGTVFWAVRYENSIGLTSFYFSQRGVTWLRLVGPYEPPDLDPRAKKVFYRGFWYDAKQDYHGAQVTCILKADPGTEGEFGLI